MIGIVARRTFALFAAIFFLLSSAGEGFGIQPCPFHDAIVDAEVAAQEEGGDHGAHGLGAHAHDAPLQQSHGAHDHHGESGLCTHVGACQSATGIHLPVVLDDLSFDSFTIETPAVSPPVERVFIAFVPYFLPYSNAPPALG